MRPQQSDLPAVFSAAQHSYDRYLRWGIHLFEWTGPMLHAKIAVIDGEWSTVGSFNLDPRRCKIMRSPRSLSAVPSAGKWQTCSKMIFADVASSRLRAGVIGAGPDAYGSVSGPSFAR